MNFSPFNGKKSFATFDNVKYQSPIDSVKYVAPIDKMSKSSYVKNGIIGSSQSGVHVNVTQNQNNPFKK